MYATVAGWDTSKGIRNSLCIRSLSPVHYLSQLFVPTFRPHRVSALPWNTDRPCEIRTHPNDVIERCQLLMTVTSWSVCSSHPQPEILKPESPGRRGFGPPYYQLYLPWALKALTVLTSGSSSLLYEYCLVWALELKGSECYRAIWSARGQPHYKASLPSSTAEVFVVHMVV